MAALCETLREGLQQWIQCEPWQGYDWRVQTPLVYPDGEVIEVYLHPRQNEVLISDKGGLEYYATRLRGISRFPSALQKELESFGRSLGVGYEPKKHEWYALVPLAQVADGVLRVAQLVSWGAVLIESRQSAQVGAAAAFHQEVAKWLDDRFSPLEIRYDFSLRGQYGSWKTDFTIRGTDTDTHLFLIYTKARSYYAFTCVSDLNMLAALNEKKNHCFGIFNEKLYKEENYIHLMSKVMRVYAWAEREQLAKELTLLLAA